MIIKGIALALVATLLPIFANAEESAIDLNVKYGECYAKAPLLDQGRNGTCYAYAVAAYANFSACSANVRTEPVDPNWVAFATAEKYRSLPTAAIDYLRGGLDRVLGPVLLPEAEYKRRKENDRIKKRADLDGAGQGSEAIQALKIAGSCPSSAIRQIERDIHARYSMSVNEFIHMVTTLFKTPPNASRAAPTAQHVSDHLEARGLNYGIEADCLGAIYLSSFEVIAKAADQTLATVNPIDILEDVFDLCTKASRASVSHVPDMDQVWVSEDPDKGIAMIMDELQAGYPALASICADFLFGPGYLAGIDIDLNRKSFCKKANGDTTAHLVNITAFQVVNGTPAFLVRNSWGPSWHPPHALACACNVEVSGKFGVETSRASMVVNKRFVYHETCPKELKANERLLGYSGCWFPREQIASSLTGVGDREW